MGRYSLQTGQITVSKFGGTSFTMSLHSTNFQSVTFGKRCKLVNDLINDITIIKKSLKRLIYLTVFVILIVMGFTGYFVNNATGDTLSFSAPGTPNLQVTNSQDDLQIKVSWADSAAGEGVVLKGYEVSRSSNGTDFEVITFGETVTYITDEGNVSYVDTVSPFSSKYYYRIRAYDDTGEFSLPSSISSTYVSGPQVVSTDPVSGADKVSLESSVSVQFDQEIDPSTVNPENIYLEIDGGTNIPGTILTYDSVQHSANISIPAKLLPDKKYLIVITNVVENTSGINISNEQTVNFTTGDDVDPMISNKKAQLVSEPINSNPHGNYAIGTQLCSSCHTSHSAVGPNLINTTTNNELCLVCHNGTQANQVSNFSFSTFETVGHFQGGNPAIKSDCIICHTPHGSEFPKTLIGPYPIDEDYSRPGFDQSQFFCTSCHQEFNVLQQVSTTSFNNYGEDLHYLHLQTLGEWGEGAAVCYECHRPHGSIAFEIDGASQNSSILGNVNLVGFPSATVQPVQGNTSPIFTPMSDGGGCTLNCHGVIHTTGLTRSGEVYSPYSNR